MEFLFYSETYKSLLQLAVASWSQFTNFQFLRQLHFLLCPGTHAVKPYRFHVGKAPCILDLSTRWPWASDYEDPDLVEISALLQLTYSSLSLPIWGIGTS